MFRTNCLACLFWEQVKIDVRNIRSIPLEIDPMRSNKGANDQHQLATGEVAHDAIYDYFILATTTYSLMVVVFLLIWPLTPATRSLLMRVDLLVCAIFLIDFLSNLIRSSNWKDYFFRGRGWLDLLGTVPFIAAPPWAGALRLARLPRMFSTARDLRAKDSEQIKQELRGDPKTALLFTILLSMVMIGVAGVVVLQIEGHALEANIRTGSDAFWWAFVTITTVGYGDHYPISGPGRFMAMILMTIGVGIFAVLTSYLASFLFGENDEQPDVHSLQDEMKALRQENAAMREQLDVVIKTLSQNQLDED